MRSLQWIDVLWVFCGLVTVEN